MLIRYKLKSNQCIIFCKHFIDTGVMSTACEGCKFFGGVRFKKEIDKTTIGAINCLYEHTMVFTIYGKKIALNGV